MVENCNNLGKDVRAFDGKEDSTLKAGVCDKKPISVGRSIGNLLL